jgi:hypothetical protein
LSGVGPPAPSPRTGVSPASVSSRT